MSHLHRFLTRRWLPIALALSALAGACAAVVNTRGELLVGAASTTVMIDYPNASIVDRHALPQDVSNLQKHAELYANLLTTSPVIARIAKREGVPAGEISGVARITASVPASLSQSLSEQRASQIVDSLTPYRLELQSSPTLPTLSIYAEAPSADAAVRLASSAVGGLHDYLRALALKQGFPVADLPRLRQLGAASGGITNRRAKYEIGALTFLTAFAISFFALFLLLGAPARRRTRAARTMVRSRLTESALADWPHTTRLLPWAVAGLIAMVWLTPFDKVQLGISAPINITLDRIVLPLVAIVWLLVRSARLEDRSRLRTTSVHVAIGLYVACAFLSVVLDAHYINQTGDLGTSIKKLPLLVTYVSVFAIVANSVRPSEVRAFLKLSLGLALVAAAEIIYEYHFQTNLFSSVFVLLPRPFEFVAAGTGPTVDSLGRSWIVGPTDYGVEAVVMLSMVLPVAVIGMLEARTRWRQSLYGLAIAILVIAIFATERKSALVGPAVVMMVLAYYRRTQLLKLAPLFLVLLVMVPVVAPGAIHGVLSQATSSNATHVATVSDRTADYDAIRPDVWTHLLFGRGYGSFDPATYRILDSEILGPLVETGVFGLLAYLGVGVSLLMFARKAVSRRRRGTRSNIGEVGVAIAACLLVSSVLYDLMGFPHGPYTFFYLAGLVVAGLRASPSPIPPEKPPETTSLQPPAVLRIPTETATAGPRRVRHPVEVG